MEEKELEELDLDAKKQRERMKRGDDSDDEGGQRVQCAQQ